MFMNLYFGLEKSYVGLVRHILINVLRISNYPGVRISTTMPIIFVRVMPGLWTLGFFAHFLKIESS